MTNRPTTPDPGSGPGPEHLVEEPESVGPEAELLAQGGGGETAPVADGRVPDLAAAHRPEPDADLAAPEPSVAEPAAADGPLPDLLDLDLEALADVSHPVLAELVGDLRRRVADQASHGLWGFDNDSPPSPGRPPA